MLKFAFKLGFKSLAWGAVLVALSQAGQADTAVPTPAPPQDPAAEALKPCADGKDATARAVSCTALIASGKLSGKALVAAYLFRGEIQAQRQELKAAIDDFSQALKLDGRAVDALYDRAEVYALMGRGDLALEDFNQLLDVVPNDPDTLSERAKLYLAAGKTQAAIDDLAKVLERRPDDDETRLQRAGLSIVIGHFEDAIADCTRILKARPDGPAVLYNRGRAEYLKADYASAATDFAAAMQNRDDNPYAALRLFLANARLRKTGAAPLARAAKAFPAEQWPMPIVAFYLGQMSEGDLLSAAGVADPAAAATLTAEAQYYLGQWALAKNDKKTARQHFKAAVAGKADRANLEVIDAGLELRRLGS